MTIFSKVIPERELATQVAALLNNNNRLNLHYSPDMILQNAWDYIVESVGNRVLGCIKIEKQSYNLTEIKHLVVAPESRGIGLAKMLIVTALRRTKTPLVYAMIRQDNITSQKAFISCGFNNSGKYTTADRNVLLYTATGMKWVKALDS